MITDANRLRCGTILGAISRAGVKTAVVTAKDKLLKVLAYEMDGIAFSSEHPDTADLSAVGVSGGEELVGRARPDQYSADLSLRSEERRVGNECVRSCRSRWSTCN